MNIRPLPSWRQKEGAHTEILLYEVAQRDEPQNDATSVSKDSHSKMIESGKHADDHRRVFHGIDSTDAQRDTGAEIAILDSLIRNGTHLDLRAFALEYLPDISLMFSTLVAVDLSYNCLRVSLRSCSFAQTTSCF